MVSLSVSGRITPYFSSSASSIFLSFSPGKRTSSIEGIAEKLLLTSMFAQPRTVLFVDNKAGLQYLLMEIREQQSGFNTTGTWTKRFMAASVVQGAVVVGLTLFLVLGQLYLKPEVSRVMAAGGAGTWLTLGYVMYILVGVLGVAVSSLFYHYLEVIMAKRLQGISNLLGWIHLVLMNAGTAAAMGMLMYAGYLGGASMLPANVGGRGFDAGQAHELLGPFTEPISLAILVLLAGVMAGGLGFLLTYRRPAKLQMDKNVKNGE